MRDRFDGPITANSAHRLTCSTHSLQIEGELEALMRVRSIALEFLIFDVLNSLRVVTVLGLPVTDTNVVHGASFQSANYSTRLCYKSIIAYL